jgi:hypothetical protein
MKYRVIDISNWPDTGNSGDRKLSNTHLQPGFSNSNPHFHSLSVLISSLIDSTAETSPGNGFRAQKRRLRLVSDITTERGKELTRVHRYDSEDSLARPSAWQHKQ